MNRKLILLALFISSWLCTWAQYQKLSIGQSAVTNSGSKGTDQVVRIFSLTNEHLAPVGDNWGIWHNLVNAKWTAENLGQVFGVTVNTNTGHIYVSTTQCYRGSAGPYLASAGYDAYEPFAAALNSSSHVAKDNIPLIWELDPTTGDYKVLVSSTDQSAFTPGTKRIFNLGTSLGNICFDKKDNLIFATNMEDGRIYSISTITGKVLERYDPFGIYTAPTTHVTAFAPRTERLWGIAYRNNVLYFSRWNEDYDVQGNPNEIYSVKISNGHFVPLAATTGPDFTDLNPTDVLTLAFNNNAPDMLNDYAGTKSFTSPIADINLSLDGKTMVFAERTMSDAYDSDPTQGDAPNWAHSSRVFTSTYDITTSKWSVPKQYFVGNLTFPHFPTSANCTGGADFGYDDRPTYNSTPNDSCEKMIWATGDGLIFPFSGGNSRSYATGVTTTVNPYVYGLAGIPIIGNTAFNSSGYTSTTAIGPCNATSIYQDIFDSQGEGDITAASTTFKPKTRPGCLSVYREPCACKAPNGILEVVDGKMQYCVGEKIVINVTIGDGKSGQWGQIYYGSNNDRDPLFKDVTQFVHTVTPDDVMNGPFVITLVTYSSNPDDGDNWCFKIENVTVTFVTCTTDVCTQFLGTDKVIKVATSIGADYHDVYSSTAPDYIIWLVDDHEEFRGTANEVFHMDYSKFPGGTHKVCLVSAHNINDSDMDHARCCFNKACEDVEIDDCPTWRSGNSFEIIRNPSNWREVRVHYNNPGSAAAPGSVNIVWHFGTEGDVVAKAEDDVTFIFSSEGETEICADITWTKNPNWVWTEENPEACCCVDHKCLPVVINHCSPWNFKISMSPNATDPTRTDFLVVPPLTGVSITHSDWSFDPFPGPVPPAYTDYSIGSALLPDVLVTGSQQVHVDATYDIYYPPSPGGIYGTLFTDCHANADVIIVAAVPPKLLAYYPNPAGDQVTIEVDANLGETCTATFMNSLGQPILDKKFEDLKSGVNHLTIGTHILENGFYYMKVTVGDQPQTVKLVKARF